MAEDPAEILTEQIETHNHVLEEIGSNIAGGISTELEVVRKALTTKIGEAIAKIGKPEETPEASEAPSIEDIKAYNEVITKKEQ